MRWSQCLIPTLKESPAEAVIPSHRLLLRAGLIRRLAGGLYTYLPLGLRVLRKIEDIVRQEMNRAGALEVLMPAVQPPEIWQRSGRYQTASEVFFRVRDRADREWILGPTHEEVVTSLMANEISSYRQLPKNLYQVQTKFRDEIRPRFGLLRAREFIMKDAYSFDTSDEQAQISYQKMYDAYVRIFHRCGLRALPVEADTGVMGGKFSHEFMVPAESGENEIAFTDSGTYAANLERATSGLTSPWEANSEESPAAALEKEMFATPGVKTIEDLTKKPFQVPAERQIKTLLMLAQDRPVLVLLLGSDQLNEAKLARVLGTGEFRLANQEEIVQALGALPGSLGPVGLQSIPVYADQRLRNGVDLVTGGNREGFHWRYVSMNRDVAVSVWADLRTVRSGEPCAMGGGPLKVRMAIEVGHVFKLGTKYSEQFEACFLDAAGKKEPIVMGCYGLGITRTMQAVIEQNRDTFGIVWPLSIAPFAVCITVLDPAPDSPSMRTAERIYHGLTDRGIETLLDDRDERPGVKFKDSELIGIPLRIAVGAKSLARGKVEFKPRAGSLILVEPGAAVARVQDWIQGQMSRLRPDAPEGSGI